MRVEVSAAQPLRFEDGSPVRAASAIAPYGEGWLIVQDDSTHACWLRGSVGTPVRLLPAVDGHEVFAERDGTKHLKPDLESACTVPGGLLLLGSGSTPARMRAVLLAPGSEPEAVVADLSDIYSGIASALGVAAAELNLEGACVIGDRLRWFQRGRPAAGVPTASIDLGLASVLAAMHGGTGSRPAAMDATIEVTVGNVHHYALGAIDGVGLAVTDAVALEDESIVVSATAEDSPNAYDDGPVVGGALALLRGSEVLEVAELPHLAAGVPKIEGLAVLDWTPAGGLLLATVDRDDPSMPSTLLTLAVTI